MDAETQARIFEPFFTTKEAARAPGSGSPPSTGSSSRAAAHRVYSEPGQGTTLQDLPPPRRRDWRSGGTAHGLRGIAAGTETILLVEDDEDVRAVVGEILRSHGYTVLEAHRVWRSFSAVRGVVRLS